MSGNDEQSWEAYDPAKWEASLPRLHENTHPDSDLESDLRISGGRGATEEEEQAFSLDLDRHWIDMEDIRQWLYTCDIDHGTKCNPATPQYVGRPLWLIDVVDECVVPAGSRQYVALSYVWGQVASSGATTENIADLQRPGVLREDHGSIKIPQTIRHAMKLVDIIGQRYLWVDRLCICQDDAETKHSQLHLMGDIYSNAYLTVIAANGWDANHGLRGIRGVTDPRHLDSQMPVGAYLGHIKPENSIWYSRGWTFQELLLSRRKLMFINQMVLWECSCGSWHESTGTSGILPGSFSRASQPRTSRYVGVAPDLMLKFNELNTLIGNALGPLPAYLQLIRAYNSRNLTFPEDGLEAFLGVTQRIMDAFPNGFFGGLPVSDFDMALLWQPGEEVKRRWPKSKSTPSTRLLPSWSWAGWQGEIDVHSWNYTFPPRQRLEKERSIKIHPLCEWRHDQGGSKVTVLPKDEKKPRSGERIVSRIKEVFATGGGRLGRDSPQASPYFLYTRASVVKCKFGNTFSNRPKPTVMRQIMHPCQPGKVCGTILMTANLANDVSEERIWEVMAISRGAVRWQSDAALKKDPTFASILASYPSNPACRSKLPTGELFFNYYNVMWIGTSAKDGTSRRRALGIMSISAWESLGPKEVDIVLG